MWSVQTQYKARSGNLGRSGAAAVRSARLQFSDCSFSDNLQHQTAVSSCGLQLARRISLQRVAATAFAAGAAQRALHRGPAEHCRCSSGLQSVRAQPRASGAAAQCGRNDSCASALQLTACSYGKQLPCATCSTSLSLQGVVAAAACSCATRMALHPGPAAHCRCSNCALPMQQRPAGPVGAGTTPRFRRRGAVWAQLNSHAGTESLFPGPAITTGPTSMPQCRRRTGGGHPTGTPPAPPVLGSVLHMPGPVGRKGGGTPPAPPTSTRAGPGGGTPPAPPVLGSVVHMPGPVGRKGGGTAPAPPARAAAFYTRAGGPWPMGPWGSFPEGRALKAFFPEGGCLNPLLKAQTEGRFP